MTKKIDGKITTGKLQVRECMLEGFDKAIKIAWVLSKFETPNGWVVERQVLENHLLDSINSCRYPKVAVLCLLLAQMDAAKVDIMIVHSKLDLMDGITGLVKVWAFGRKSHKAGSWKKVSAEEFQGVIWRHLLARKSNPLDVESGLPHSFHMLFSAMANVHNKILMRR